jgi:phage-related protein
MDLLPGPLSPTFFHGAKHAFGRHGWEHRVMYVAKFEEAVYVLHAFEKRSRQTRDTDLALARERLKQVEALRREERRRR